MDENNVTSTPTMADYYGMIKAEHEANNAWSAEQAQKAMDYQTEMSNTAHQREVADLKAAGLNPILSAGGQGATTGTGQVAQRDDSNIDALYGLTKMAIESNIAQANAMANTAKYSSGHAGTSNPSSIVDGLMENVYSAFDSVGDKFGSSSGKSNSTKNKKTTGTQYYKDYFGDEFPLISLLGDALKLFGVSKDTTYATMESIDKGMAEIGKMTGDPAWFKKGALGAFTGLALNGSNNGNAKPKFSYAADISKASSSKIVSMAKDAVQKAKYPKGRKVNVSK